MAGIDGFRQCIRNAFQKSVETGDFFPGESDPKLVLRVFSERSERMTGLLAFRPLPDLGW